MILGVGTSRFMSVVLLVGLASACQAGDDRGSTVTVRASTVSTSSLAPLDTDEDAAATDVTDVTDVTDATGVTDAAVAPVVPTSTAAPGGTVAVPATFGVVTLEGVVTDRSRNREVPYLVYAPVGLTGPVPLILVSHGGAGNTRGHLAAPHLGTTFAAGGFVAVHLAHAPSSVTAGQLTDRPADVTFLLDQLEDGALALPADFAGTVDLTRVGHTGHSFGAYTAHAVGGATYRRTYRDERIDAIAPISPQGPDQFGAFDDGPTDNTWITVTIPVYNLIGGAEIDSNAVDTIDRPGWRLVPFDRYPGTSDTFQTIIDDQVHADMWREGSADVKRFIAIEILEFMRVYVAGVETDPCAIGIGDLSLAHTERRPATGGSLITACS